MSGQQWEGHPVGRWRRLNSGAGMRPVFVPCGRCCTGPVARLAQPPAPGCMCPALCSTPHCLGRYAIGGIGAVCHTLNPRLFEEDLQYIINHAQVFFFFGLLIKLDCVGCWGAAADRGGCNRSACLVEGSAAHRTVQAVRAWPPSFQAVNCFSMPLQDSVILADTTFVGLLESLVPRCPSVKHVVLFTGAPAPSKR